MSQCYISVDIEATGPVPSLYSMYELGACVAGEEDKQFMREIKLLTPDSYDQKTLSEMRTSIDVLLARPEAEDPWRTMEAFAAWVETVRLGRTPVFVANNAPFDWMFVAWYFRECGATNPFGHAALDMKAYFMGKTNCSWRAATLNKMASFCGVPFVKLPHRAIDDAVIQSKIFFELLKR